MIVKAPGVVKLLGEHAVVYGRLAVAIGINLYAKANVSKTKSKVLAIDAADFQANGSFDRESLEKIYDSYKSKKSIDDYAASQNIPKHLLPFATIASRLLREANLEPTGLKVTLHSGIPLQKGLASSAALCTAFTVALVKAAGANLSDEMIIDIARDGDRIIHKNENAGRIDVSTSFYGGYTTFSTATGAKKQDISKKLRLLVVDTGPKRSTAEPVGHVAQLYQSDRDNVSALFDRINQCALDGIEAIKSSRLKKLGKYMYEDQELLRMLGVSNDALDRAVLIAKDAKAYGAKLSGGGGGGIAIILCGKNKEAIASRLREEKFDVIPISMSAKGAKDYL